MKATIDRHGRVNIEFESQAECLDAPGGKKYLPCDGGCGRLLTVERMVVSIVCPECQEDPLGAGYDPIGGDGRSDLPYGMGGGGD